MNDIFIISKLLIKKKLKVLTDFEKEQLKQFNEEYSFSKNINFDHVTQKISDYSNINKDKAWQSLAGKIKFEKKNKVIPLFKLAWFKYAAVLVLFFCLGYFYHQGYFSKQAKLEIPISQITLQLDNGVEKIIDEKESTALLNDKGLVIGTQKGKQLLYNNTTGTETLVYNTIKVPYGKRFELQLSDGTKVTVNAGSSLKYPVRFIEGEDRRVFLKGEAFFDVTKDEKHPFIVNANEINVRVLGTTFNMSSYPEDANISTVLVEGSVVAYEVGDHYLSNSAVQLKPNYKAAWHKNNKIIKVEKTDIETHIAWVEGRLVLHEVAFSDILKKLERQYNVVIINNNKKLESRFFTAKFDIENIYQVLESLSLSGNFSYKVNKNIININP